MASVFQTQSWAIKVPDSWEVDDDGEAVAFVPGEVEDAALIVSVFHKNSAITMGEMLEAIQRPVHIGTSFQEVRLGDFTGYHTVYVQSDEDGESAWRAWCVFCGEFHLYITYNCSLQRRGKDDLVVDGMLRTVMCLRED